MCECFTVFICLCQSVSVSVCLIFFVFTFDRYDNEISVSTSCCKMMGFCL